MLTDDIVMRQAADVLDSAPAMQIRYLEAMQAMAKSSNSKVIFLPAVNQTVQQQIAHADAAGEGPSNYGINRDGNGNESNSLGMQSSTAQEYGGGDRGFQSAINSHVIENM
jgi:erythrocyte band 7 integral membrane protein